MNTQKLTTVVADNRLMADTIARAIGANQEHDGYYLGNGYAVTWTNGTLIEATFKPDERFVINSGQDMRKMYAHHFAFSVRDIDEIVGYEKSKSDNVQLAVITALWKMSGTVVNAMYPTLEGELNFLNLYWHLHIPVTVRRAWLPKLDKMTIVKAVENGPINAEKHEKWLSSRLVNHFIKEDKAARAEMTNADAVNAETVNAETQNVETKTSVDTPVSNMEESVVEEVENAVATIEAKYVGNTPSGGKPLYNLVTLWMDSMEELGYEYDRISKIAHTLYAKKLITFPSENQTSVPETVSRAMDRNIRVLEHNGKWGHLAKVIGRVSRRNNFRNGETGFDGYGIVTTGLHPIGLTHDEEKLYNIIVRRVIDAFTPALPMEKYAGKSAKKHKVWKNRNRKAVAKAS